jgi:RNA polymerase sigma factor (TIGR02999 family)
MVNEDPANDFQTINPGHWDAASVTAILNSADSSRLQMDQVFALVYGELKPVARNLLAKSSHQTLSPTAVVHEAYAKLIGSEQLNISGRRHFFALAARTMRQIIVDYARGRLADKRGSGRIQVEISDAGLIDLEQPESLVAMDEALKWVEEQDPRLAELIHLRVYAALELDEIAVLMELTPRQLQRDWQRGRAWMTEALLYPPA